MGHEWRASVNARPHLIADRSAPRDELLSLGSEATGSRSGVSPLHCFSVLCGNGCRIAWRYGLFADGGHKAWVGYSPCRAHMISIRAWKWMSSACGALARYVVVLPRSLDERRKHPPGF